jgi:hypothetical protein
LKLAYDFCLCDTLGKLKKTPNLCRVYHIGNVR